MKQNFKCYKKMTLFLNRFNDSKIKEFFKQFVTGHILA